MRPTSTDGIMLRSNAPPLVVGGIRRPFTSVRVRVPHAVFMPRRSGNVAPTKNDDSPLVFNAALATFDVICASISGTLTSPSAALTYDVSVATAFGDVKSLR